MAVWLIYICLHKVTLLRHSVSDPCELLKHMSAGIVSLLAPKKKNQNTLM